MPGFMLQAIISLLVPPAAGYFWRAVFRSFGVRNGSAASGWISSAASGLTYGAVRRDWGYAAGAAVSLAVALAVWWWKRRRRDRAPRAYGAKSRALVAALVRKAREAAKPRPVLRPVPGGAR